MKLLVVVSCLIVAVAATPLLGTEQCAKGPGVWCVDIRTASQCRAVKHCQQTVWNKPVVKTVPCDLCKEVMSIVENFLKDNTTQNEILSYLDKACELLVPDPAMASQCKELVGEYFPILLNIIEEELGNPSVACSALHLCTSLQQHLAGLKEPQQLLSNEIPEIDLHKVVYPYMANLPLLLTPQDGTPNEPKNVDVCKDCLQLITDVQELLKTNSSFSKMLIENALKQCDQLGGGLSDMCKTYINQYADLALQMMIQLPAQQMCSAVGLCTQEKSAPMLKLAPAKVLVPAKKLQPAVKITEKPVELNPICEMCEIVVQKFESCLEKNSTQDEIMKALEKVCKIVPQQYRQKCVDFIDTYSEAIIELLEQELTPKEICAVLGLCGARLPKMAAKLSPEPIPSVVSCEVCKEMMIYIDKILQKNCTEQRIKHALEVVCSYMSESMVEECVGMVKAYEPLFIQLILQALDPTFVCEKMNMCLNAKKPLLGSEKCMWGPSYWCKDMETAGRCNAIEHCKRHVWN